MKKKTKKLVLAKETVRRMSGPSLEMAVGGGPVESGVTDACFSDICTTSVGPRMCINSCWD